MRPGRSLALAILLLASLATASPLVDPYLEDLRVGRHGGADEIVLVDGWPAGLFEPAHWSVAWEAAWRQAAFDPAGFLEQAPGLCACFSTDDEALAWLAARIRAWDGRDALASDGEARDPAFLTGALLAKRALDQSRAGDARRALATIDDLLRILPTGEIDDLERFAWSLRARALRASLGDTAGPDVLWPDLLALGPYDRNTGWTIWTAIRRHRNLPLLPTTPADTETVLFLASLRESGLVARDLDRSPYARDAKAALGAAVLAKSALRRHFGLYPDPPADERLQEHWLRGRWRQLGYTAAAAEKLAALPGLADEHRAGYLRRAADKQASTGFWGSVVSNLHAARLAAERGGRRSVIDRVRIETERVAALTAHQGLERASTVLRDLLDATGDERAEGRLGDARAIVRDGRASRLAGTHDYRGLASARAGTRRAWARLGARLAREQTDPEWRDYGVLLQASLATGEPALERAVARALTGVPWREEILDWALARTMIERASGDLPAEQTPVVGLAGRRKHPLERHLLLGVSLLLGDARGQLAATVKLSRSGLTRDENLLLLYPVPTDAFVMDTLRASGLDPALVLAVARNESLFDPAVRSRSGALGWMQIMPFHYPGRGYHEGEVIWRKFSASLTAGLDLLAVGSRRYDGDPYRTLADYNAGPSAVRRWDAQLGAGAPAATFLAWIGYPETRRYVEKVLIDRHIYAWILRGAEGVHSSAPE